MMVFLRRVVRHLTFIIETISKVLTAVTGFLPIMMTILIALNVLLRYVFRSPMVFEYELVQVMLLASLWLPQAYIFHRDKAIRVELFFSTLGVKGQTGVKLIGHVIGIFYFAVITKACWEMAIYSFKTGSRSVHLSRWPMGPQQLVVVIGCGALCLMLLLKIGHSVASLMRPRNVSKGT